MKKQYVPKTLTEYLSESKSISLKRKYGERPAISAGTNAPLRNQVLSFVAENAQVSKRDLKQFIVGLREGGATVASANMFIKRNAKYFMTESKNGITYFKLSNLGQRLVNQFVPAENGNVSESVKNARKSLNMILENKQAIYEDDDEEIEGTPEDLEGEDEMEADDMEADDIDSEEGPADEVDFDEDRFADDEDVDDEGEESGDLEERIEELEDKLSELEAKLAEYEGEDPDEDPEEDELDDDDLDDEDLNDEDDDDDEDMDDEEGEDDRPAVDPEDLDFEEDAVLDDMDEAEKTPQFPTNKLTGKKSDKFGGRYSKAEYHNLLDDNEDKDNSDIDSIEKELTEHDTRVQRMKDIIENLKGKKSKKVNEAEESTEDDELKDDDLDTDVSGDGGEEDIDATPEDNGVEKVEITEFIITVDDPDAAITELEELGITAQRVPVEEKPAEVAPETEEEPSTDDIPAETPEETPTDTATLAKESLKAFVTANYLNEEGENADPGVSDDLGLGDQGAEATELDNTEGEEPVDATTEFEENKIKVEAADWDILKGWLEEKGVDVKEMFGGDIETEEVGDEDGVAPEGDEEVGDDEIDFSGIGDKDETKVEEGYESAAELAMQAEEEKKMKVEREKRAKAAEDKKDKE